MGGKDHCAVVGCSNNRNKPDKLVVKDHVGILRWHTPKTTQDINLWNKLIKRDKFQVTKNTKVCSNHFTAGYCSDVCRIPTLFMRGYNEEETIKRKSPNDSTSLVMSPKRTKAFNRNGEDIDITVPITTPFMNDHDYELTTTTLNCSITQKFRKCIHCFEKDIEIKQLKAKIAYQEREIESLKKELVET